MLLGLLAFKSSEPSNVQDCFKALTIPLPTICPSKAMNLHVHVPGHLELLQKNKDVYWFIFALLLIDYTYSGVNIVPRLFSCQTNIHPSLPSSQACA